MSAALLLISALAAPPQTAPDVVTGVRLEGTVIVDGIAAVAGGLESGTALPYLVRGGLIATGDAVGWPGLRLNLSALVTGGTAPGRLVGDIQGTSNIVAAGALRPYEAWVQQNLGQGLSVLAGLYDINSEFDVNEAAGLFLNSSFGIGPDFSLAGPNGPGTFPATGLAVRVATAPLPHIRARLAVVDGTPGDPADATGIDLAWRRGDGALVVGEAAYLLGLADASRAPQGGRRFLGRGASEPGAGAIAAGAWRFSGVDARGDGPSPRGAYLLAERRLKGPEDRVLTVFARAGLAEGVPVGRFVRLGVRSGGWLARAGDEASLGLAVAWPDADYRNRLGLPGANPETVVELTYRANLARWLFIQPDFQYVLNPMNGSAADHAVVLMVRVAALH